MSDTVPDFISQLDGDSSEGLQFKAEAIESFFNTNHLQKTKESRSKSTTDMLLKLPDIDKKSLKDAISDYLNNVIVELSNNSTCKAANLISIYPTYPEAIAAIKKDNQNINNKLLNIACALISIHSVLTQGKQLHYEEASKYAEEYICNTNTPKNNNKNATITESPIKTGKDKDKIISTLPNQIDKIPTFLKQKIQGDETLNNCTLGDIQQDLKNNNYDLGSSGPNKDGVDGLRGEKTKKALENYFSKKSEKKDNVLKDPAGLSKIPTPKGEEEKNIVKPKTPEEKGEQEAIIEQDDKSTTDPNPIESLPENNNFEKEKTEIIKKTTEIKTLVTNKSPQTIKTYVDSLRSDTTANPFITYTAIMGGLNHINDADRQSIVDKYYTILGKLQKERKEGATFEDDISLIANFLHDNSTYYERPKDQKNLDESSSLLGLKNTSKNNKLQFDCSSYSFFVYCIMSELGHTDIGMADSEKAEHGIFVHNNNSSGNLTPYDFSNIEKSGSTSLNSTYAQYERNMKNNIPTNISLLISEYNPPQPTIYSTYFAILCSQHTGINTKTKEKVTAYERSLYDDFANTIRTQYKSDLQTSIENKQNLTSQQIKLAQDIITLIDSDIHTNVSEYKVSDGEWESLQYIKTQITKALKRVQPPV